MPGFIAKKICKDIVFLKPNYEKYRKISLKFREVLERYDSMQESVGYDESAIDVT